MINYVEALADPSCPYVLQYVVTGCKQQQQELRSLMSCFDLIVAGRVIDPAHPSSTQLQLIMTDAQELKVFSTNIVENLKVLQRMLKVINDSSKPKK